MITAAQMRAARLLLVSTNDNWPKWLAYLVAYDPAHGRRSDGTVEALISWLTKLVDALERAGIRLIGDNTVSSGGGHGIRLKNPG